jgi:aminoglycoside phosphotransferase (APT) family kinase protein
MSAVEAAVDLAALEAWLRARADVRVPLVVEAIEGGRSNLTFLVTDADGRRFVLRRPPLSSVLSSAHDVAREHRLMTALAGSDVPVPACVGLESDPSVIGAPFVVMHHVDGLVVRSVTEAARLSDVARRRAGEDLVDVLARLHALDPVDVGLGDLAAHDGYVARQLRRWSRQVTDAGSRFAPLLVAVHDALVVALAGPIAPSPATIVHGDYRLDNVIVDPASGALRAVLDWELATLGDPLADVGLLLVHWAHPGEEDRALGPVPTLVAGFPSRDEVIARYSAASGRDLAGIGPYVALGQWKLACILAGVVARAESGAYGDDASAHLAYARVVEDLAERARDGLARG